MEKFVQETLEKIRAQHIRPDPRWKHLAKKYGLWLLFALALILAALSFSSALGTMADLDWDLYHHLDQNPLSYFLSLLPYLWILPIAILLPVAFFEIRRTETGYRYSRKKIALITLGGIIIFSLFISSLNLGHLVQSKLSASLPSLSHHLLTTKESQWTDPESGLLAGTIVSAGQNHLSIEDLAGNDWMVSLDEKTLIRPAVNLSPDETIKIIGTQKDKDDFHAQEIRPWTGKGKMMEGAAGQKRPGPAGHGKGKMHQD